MNKEEKLLDVLWTAYCEVIGVDPTDKEKQHCFLSGMACVCSFVEEGSEQVRKGMEKERVAKSFQMLSRAVKMRMRVLDPKS